EKTARVGFEWNHKDQVWEKVLEEMDELREALDGSFSPEKREEELGDVFFSLINFARFENIDSEPALERINQKFKRRFEFIEKHAPKSLTEMSLDEMDALWNQAKGEERS